MARTNITNHTRGVAEKTRCCYLGQNQEISYFQVWCPRRRLRVRLYGENEFQTSMFKFALPMKTFRSEFTPKQRTPLICWQKEYFIRLIWTAARSARHTSKCTYEFLRQALQALAVEIRQYTCCSRVHGPACSIKITHWLGFEDLPEITGNVSGKTKIQGEMNEVPLATMTNKSPYFRHTPQSAVTKCHIMPAMPDVNDASESW